MTVAAAQIGIDPLHFRDFQYRGIALRNAGLKAELASFADKLNSCEKTMGRLTGSNDLLRTVVNLPPIPRGVREVGIGGVKENFDYGVSTRANALIASATLKLQSLYRDARLQRRSYDAIRRQYKMDEQLYRDLPAIDPVTSDLVSSPFGMRFHPILHIMLMHEGMDFAVNVGTKVHATGHGTVEYVGREGGYGNVVEIKNGFGYTTLFAHLEKALVRVGQRVERGQVIALSGDTGLSTGPHLHYEVRKNGIHVNPAGYFFSSKQFRRKILFKEIASIK